MKRVLLFCGLTFLLGLSVGLFSHALLPDAGSLPLSAPPATNGTPSNALTAPSTLPSTTVPDSTPDEPESSDTLALLEQGFAVLDALRDRNYEALSAYVSSSGVRFTPYSTADPAKDLVLTPAQIAAAPLDTQVYRWGTEDGSGEPIELTIPDYISRFVYNADYLNATRIGINQVVQGGNALENVAEVYPDCTFLDFNFSGLDPSLEGLDWCSLKLVFRTERNSLKLVGILHGEWTI